MSLYSLTNRLKYRENLLSLAAGLPVNLESELMADLIDGLKRDGITADTDPDFAKKFTLSAVKYLVETLSINPNCYDDAVKETPLIKASGRGDLAMVRLLLSLGADVKESDIHGNTALHAAASGGHDALIVLLREAKSHIDAINVRRESPIHLAVKHPNAVNVLLRLGASIDALTKSKMTPLHCAIQQLAPVETLNVLLKFGADVTLMDNQDRTPLQFAQEENSYLSQDYCKVLQQRELALSEQAKMAGNAARQALLLGREDSCAPYGSTESRHVPNEIFALIFERVSGSDFTDMIQDQEYAQRRKKDDDSEKKRKKTSSMKI